MSRPANQASAPPPLGGRSPAADAAGVGRARGGRHRGRVAAGSVIWWRAVVALVVAVALQVGTNYANDYSDGVRGTDNDRVGPVRLVASGLASPPAVQRAAVAAFGWPRPGGLALAAAAGWWLILVGAACIAAGWLYTGGPRPYGYAGLGELFVFVFFGLVATVGTAYVQVGRITGLAVAAAVPVGLLAVALLVVNNLRDIPGDTRRGKRTLAVRIGATATRTAVRRLPCWSPSPWPPALAVSRPGSLLALLALPLALPPVRQGRSAGEEGKGSDRGAGGHGRLSWSSGPCSRRDR